MFDVVVFTQDELIKAIQNGCDIICLCDNAFEIPAVPDKKYIALGDVTAKIECTSDESQKYKIEFCGFVPVFSKTKRRDGVRYGSHSSINSYFSSYRASYTSFFGSFGSFGSSCPGMAAEYFEDIWVNGYGINLI